MAARAPESQSVLVCWAPAVGLALSSALGTQPRKRWVLISQSPPPGQGAQANPGEEVGLAVCVGGAQGCAARGSGGEGGGPQEVALQGRCCVTGVLGGALGEEHFRLTAS